MRRWNSHQAGLRAEDVAVHSHLPPATGSNRRRGSTRVLAVPDRSCVLRWVLAAWVVALVLALYPYTADPASPIKHLLTGVFAAAGGALACAAALWGPWPGPGRALGVLAGFLGGFLPPTLFSGHGWHALDALAPWLLFFVMAGLASVSVRDVGAARRLFGAVVVAAVMASLYGFLQAAGLDPFPWSTRSVEEYRGLPSTYANPNFAGHALVIAIPLGLYLAWQGAGWARAGWLAAAGVLIAHLLWTNMRGGAAALVCGLGFAGVLWAARQRVRPVRLGIVLLAGGMVLAGAGLAGAITRSLSSEEPLPLDGSLVLRLNGYYGAARMLLDHSLLGLGPGGYALQVPAYWTAYEARWFAQTGKKNTHAHNDVLEAGAEGGVLGAGAYLALMVYAVLAALRLMQSPEQDRRALGVVLAAVFSGFMVDGLFGFNLRVPVSGGLYFLMYGVLAGVADRERPWGRWASLGLLAALFVLSWVGLAHAAVNFLGERACQFAAGAREYAVAAAGRGEGAASRNALAQADAALAEAAGLLPGDARPWEMRGHVALLGGDAALAAGYFAEGLRRAPCSPSLLVARARALTEVVRQGVEQPWRYSAAEVWRAGLAAEWAALRARGLCPPLGAAHETLGRLAALRARGTDDPVKAGAYRGAAQAHLLEALARGGVSQGLLVFELAELSWAAGDGAAALRWLRRAVMLDPRNARAWDRLEAIAGAQGAGEVYADALAQVLHSQELSAAVRGDLLERLAVATGSAGDVVRLAAVTAEGLRSAPQRLAFWGLYLAGHPESAPGAALRRAVQESGVAMGVLPQPVRALVEASAERGPLFSLYAAELLLSAGQYARAESLLAGAVSEVPEKAREAGLLLWAQALEGLGRLEEALALTAEARAAGSLAARRQYARRLGLAGQGEAARLEYEALLRQMSPEESGYEVIAGEYRGLLPDPAIF